MIITAKNGREVCLRQLHPGDFDNLYDYLQNLSANTKHRFAPHEFDKQSILDLYKNPNEYLGYVAVDVLTNQIVAYSILKMGWLAHDLDRLQSYGLVPDAHSDCTFAPSVADQWQSCGVGNALFSLICSDLKARGIKQIILWAGVDSDNQKAINFYIKNGFRFLGQFEYNGRNDDMILELF